MSDQCEHAWGEVEEVELGIGIVHSPLCKHCGAVKLEVGRQVAERRRQAWLEREVRVPTAVVTPSVMIGEQRRLAL